MATLPTNFSVTKVRSCPIPNPDTNTPKPELINSESAASVDSPDLFTSLDAQSVNSPVVIGSESQPNVDTPYLIEPKLQPDIDAPDLITSESEQTIPVPNLVTPNSGTPTTPPFPLNHARIQWDNLLFNYTSVVQDSGENPAFAIIPNSYQRWTFDAGGSITITLPAAVNMDTVCIGSHNLSGSDYTVGAEYDSTASGTFTPFETGVSPTTNNAIMFHRNTEVSVRRLKITASGTGNDRYIGYISAGIALQMQRPFFNGYTPMTDERFTEFYTSWTETRNIIGREVRRRGIENSPSWRNLDDTWYRTYLEPIKDTIEVLPFFMAWNLLEYPDDVGMMILTNFFSAPMQNGRMIRRDVSMQMTGVL